ncbi:hypothetical protein [Acholeplasma hippikon]|uniref:Uncharacterized protein n=2 Tax=Acholeplasma hippikon TaxID=264636 RepID=A0A449BK49_9MOLU|nr:hypothetical protein [Acholeplasma hippikon]VEU82828.1 Uncharacterised protein [Acholeplasma hippikon]
MHVKYKKTLFWLYLLITIPFTFFSLFIEKLMGETYYFLEDICFGMGLLISILLIYKQFFSFISYEAKFEENGIIIIKGKKEIFIDIKNIKDIKYDPTQMEDTLETYSYVLVKKALNIKLKEPVRYRKYLFIKLVKEDYEKLPKAYVNLISNRAR